MWYLIGDLFGRKIRYPLSGDIQHLAGGSLPDNDLYFPYRGVSRRHFILERSGEDWRIRDVDSKNGIIHNGMKKQSAALAPGDTIRIGLIEFAVAGSIEDADTLPIGRLSAPSPDEETDETGTLDIHNPGSVLVFPDLVFPDGYIPGASEQMVAIYQKIHALAAKDLNILLAGETGVGKEMLARTLHLSSPRAKGPFVPINCAAIPADLAEAELFGIGEKVATGVAGRTGKFVSAHKGTLFLDDLGALPADIQAKLLRAVEDKKIFPVGRTAGQTVDLRILSATNKDPRELIRSGKLREDLYHRLATVEIAIPPLRERRGDLEALILGLLNGLSLSEKKPLGGISRILLSNLRRRDWPGNVRELHNLLKAMTAAAHPGEILDVRLLPAESDPLSSATDDLHEVLDETAKQRIREALKLHNGNITRAAKHLNLSTVGLRKMMKRLGITKNGM